MKSYTRDEFIEYVKNLKLDSIEDMADFVLEYYDYYDKIPESDEKKEAWEKYMILMAKYGMIFVSFSQMVLQMKNKMNEEYGFEEEKLKNGNSAPLAR